MRAIPYGYVYITENLINHKRYIGQHKSESLDESYKGSGTLIQRAFEKYGWDNFQTEILEWCQSREELNAREKYWISYYNAVNSPDFYNILSGGEGVSSEDVMGEKNPRWGVSLSDEIKAKISIANRGRKLSEDAKKRISESHKGINSPNYGKHLSEDVRRKLSDAQLGERSAWYGRSHSKDSEEKMRKSQSGKKNYMYGKCHTEESKEKIRQAALRHKPHIPKRVVQYSADMKELNRFKSVTEAAESVDVSPKQISYVCKGWRRTSRGFIWRYECDVDKSVEDLRKLYS